MNRAIYSILILVVLPAPIYADSSDKNIVPRNAETRWLSFFNSPKSPLRHREV